MATLIQKLANVVNIIDTNSNKIKETIHLSAKADIRRNFSTPDLIVFESEEGSNSPTVKFSNTIEYQDEGGTAQLWVGTIDDFVNKINNEYLVPSTTGGGVSNVIVDNNPDPSTETKQDVRIDQEDYIEDIRGVGDFSSGFPFDLQSGSNFEIQYRNSTTTTQFTHEFADVTVNDAAELATQLNSVQNLLEFYPLPFNEYQDVFLTGTFIGVRKNTISMEDVEGISIPSSEDGDVDGLDTLGRPRRPSSNTEELISLLEENNKLLNLYSGGVKEFSFSGTSVSQLPPSAGTFVKVHGISDRAGGDIRFTVNGVDPTANSADTSNSNHIFPLDKVLVSAFKFRGSVGGSQGTIFYTTLNS